MTPFRRQSAFSLRNLLCAAAICAPSSTAFIARDVAAEGPKKAQDPAAPDRLYADSFLVWIYQQPKRDVTPIGYIRGGDSVALRADGNVPAGTRAKKGCGKGWDAVAPAGYVCLDHAASLTPTRYSESMRTLRPQSGPYPFQYALSMGTPSYRRVPEQAEWEKRERGFGEAKPRPLPPHWRGHEELITDERLTSSEAPAFLQMSGSASRETEPRLIRRTVPFGSMLALTGSFESRGRQFLQSADGTIVPADRLRLFKRSEFEGVPLGAGTSSKVSLPLAWTRKRTRRYSIVASADCAIDGSKTSTATPNSAEKNLGKLKAHAAQLPLSCLKKIDVWSPARERRELTGRIVDVAGTRFAELRGEAGSGESEWIPTRYLFIAEAQDRRSMSGSTTKWIHFSIGQGTLVTYQGETPTFATLASPGIGGVPAPGADPLATRTTPVGTYRIQFKHHTDDMSPEQTEDRAYWIADVPFAMYFKQPFAIHVAYWHDSFGEPMSGGCINVSPKDGERLFSFADPPLPPDWYGVGASSAFGLGTTLVIER